LSRRCERNRKRSKRRAIYCPIHGCYMDSVSQKHAIFTRDIERLRQKGISKRSAQFLLAYQNTVVINGEWIEAFWCDQCQQTNWYHVQKEERTYRLSVAPAHLWQQAIGVLPINGNPSVSQFTKTQARLSAYQMIPAYRYLA
jgi:hypothetical protein